MKFDGQKIFFKDRQLQCEIGPKNGSIAEAHSHSDYYQVEVLFEGHMTDLHGRDSERVNPGRISIYNPDDPHRTDYVRTNSLIYAVSRDYMNEFTRTNFGIKDALFNYKKAHHFPVPVENIFSEIRSLDVLGPASESPVLNEVDYIQSLQREDKTRSILKTILNSLALGSGFFKNRFSNEKNYHVGVIQRSLDYMQGAYRQRLSLEQIASQSGMSNFHFSRIFKKILGKSPYQYLIQLRVNEAERQLKWLGFEKIESIAHSCGFRNSKQLIYHLQKHTQ